MKKIQWILFLCLSLPAIVWANAPTDAPEQAAAQEQAVAPVQEVQAGSCKSLEAKLPSQCKESDFMDVFEIAKAQAAQRESAQAGASVEAGEQVAHVTRQKVDAVMAVCSQAAQLCREQCNHEIDFYNSQKQYQQAQAMHDAGKNCNKIEGSMKTAQTMAWQDIAKILGVVGALAESLGMASRDGGVDAITASVDDEDNPCLGENAHLMIECDNAVLSPGTRSASLSTGVGSVNGAQPSLDGLAATADNPIETAKASDKKNGSFGSAGAGFGAAGLGGFGSNSGGSSDNGSGDSESGIKTAGGKGGFMGVGGGSTGGGYSGGSGGRSAVAPIGKFGSGSGLASGAQIAALNKQLNAAKSKGTGGGRKLASTGANGPFDDNWAVITKAYKKNSSTLFHQK